MLFACGCAPKQPFAEADLLIGEPYSSHNQSALYRPVAWKALKGWKNDNHSEAIAAFLASCGVMEERLQEVCGEAKLIESGDDTSARIFFETYFQPYEVIGDGEKVEGLVTGYYLPLLKGSRKQTARYKYPIYKKPSDMVIIDLNAFGLGRKSVRGRVSSDGKVIPYYDRAAIDQQPQLLKGSELFWVDDPIKLFFMHIQGSGLVQTPDGNIHQLSYASQNGHPYYPIGAYLIENDQIPKAKISMHTIREWLLKNPKQMWSVLHKNPSYIFFEESDIKQGTRGTQGVALTDRRSIAVDPSFISLGTPVFISAEEIKKLTIAQDTGGAIKGAVRADFFWGQGSDAETNAGNMKTNGRLFILLPK